MERPATVHARTHSSHTPTHTHTHTHAHTLAQAKFYMPPTRPSQANTNVFYSPKHITPRYMLEQCADYAVVLNSDTWFSPGALDNMTRINTKFFNKFSLHRVCLEL